MLDILNSLPPAGSSPPIDYNSYMFFYDFSDLPLGSQTAVDRSGKTSLTRRTFGAGPYADGVVDHPTLGRCYQFDGKGYFANDSPNASKLATTTRWTLETEFLSSHLGGDFVFSTGIYDRANQSGMSLSMNQFPQTFIQLFLTNGSQFARVLPPGTNDFTKRRIRATRNLNTYTLTNLDTGQTAQANLTINTDSFFYMGFSNPGNTTTQPFRGFIKYLVAKPSL